MGSLPPSLAGARRATRKPKGCAAPRRRIANSRARALPPSIQWRSSIAIIAGCSASAVRARLTAIPRARRSIGSSPGSVRRSASSRARRSGGDSSRRTSSTSGERRSVNATKERSASDSVGRLMRIRRPESAASRRIVRHRIVFPMPGSPSMTRTAGPPADARRKRSPAATSSPRPTRLITAASPLRALDTFGGFTSRVCWIYADDGRSCRFDAT